MNFRKEKDHKTSENGAGGVTVSMPGGGPGQGQGPGGKNIQL